MVKNIILLLLCLPLFVNANGDPTDRLSALTRSANPTPRTITDIHIIKEDLKIKPGIRTKVSVTYLLWNASDKDYMDIDYGFPVDYEGAGEKLVNSPLYHDYYSASSYVIGWHDDYVQNIRFAINDTPLSYEVSPEIVITPCPYTDEELESMFALDDIRLAESEEFYEVQKEAAIGLNTVARRWFYTRFSIAAGETVSLSVEYILRNSHTRQGESPLIHYTEDMLSSYKLNNNSFLYYDLAPAAHWGNGKARDIHIEIDISGIQIDTWNTEIPDSPHVYGVYGLPFKKRDNKLIYTARNFDFKDAAPLYIKYNLPASAFLPLQQLLSWRIPNNKFIVNTSGEVEGYPAGQMFDMDIETTWATPFNTNITDTITIIFEEPVELGAILIVGGYHKNAQTYYNNNRPKVIKGKIDIFKEHQDTRDKEFYVNFPEDWSYQSFSFEDILFHCIPVNLYGAKALKLELYITSVYPGSRYNDTCISEIILLNTGIINYTNSYQYTPYFY